MDVTEISDDYFVSCPDCKFAIQLVHWHDHAKKSTVFEPCDCIAGNIAK